MHILNDFYWHIYKYVLINFGEFFYRTAFLEENDEKKEKTDGGVTF